MIFKSLCLLAGLSAIAPVQAQTYVDAQVSVCFRPDSPGGCISSIVDWINAAKTEIRVQAYNFTSPLILSALAHAKQRGVDVQVILDKVNDPLASHKKINPTGEEEPVKVGPYTGATFMTNANIPTYIDRKPKIAHNKLIIIDGHLVIGGSYNYSLNAERFNAENVTFIDSQQVATWFLDNWKRRLEVSEPFVSPALMKQK